MIELASEKYHLLTEPLNRVTMNKLFARSVIERKVGGRVYVDHPIAPSTFYILHPYGMSLLFGRTDNEAFTSVAGPV